MTVRMRKGLRAFGLAMAGVATISAGPALSHPHVFIDAGVEVIFDAEGRAEALRIEWAYDELFSLVVIEEQGLDADMDGVLTEAENAVIHGFDMEWDADFPGDTYALSGETPLALSRPAEFSARYEGGRLISTHLRRFETPVALTAPLVVQVYDPGFYTSYVIAKATTLTGRPPEGCEAVIYEPDRAAADAILAQALEEYAGEDAEFPAIGAAYAEEVRITCPAP